MKPNRSPWLHQLRQDREVKRLDRDIETDVVIIGAGIAGVSTAFFVLKHTDKRVALFEAFKLAHGATGHNAGQIVSYFERGFSFIVERFGLEMAAEGQQSVEDAWQLLEEMYEAAELTIPLSSFIGHAGLSTEEQVLFHLKNNQYRKQGQLNTERILISENASFLNNIPESYKELYEVAPKSEIQKLLETESEEYHAVLSYRKGCLNSALFCEEIVLYLLKKYPDRFALYEHTPILKTVLHDDRVVLDAETHAATAERVVLCTNGFDDLHVMTAVGLAIDTKLHHSIHGVVGYMSGYLEKMNKLPGAWSYLLLPSANDEYYKSDPDTGDPYFLLTRRPFIYDGKAAHNLISVAGPETALTDRRIYSRDAEYPESIIETLDRFVKSTYDTDPNKKIDYIFTWHGLMGYTKNGIRLIGPEPKNPLLMYNMGCNGVGILPSIFGGKRIAEMLAGKEFPPSIFDIPQS